MILCTYLKDDSLVDAVWQAVSSVSISASVVVSLCSWSSMSSVMHSVCLATDFNESWAFSFLLFDLKMHGVKIMARFSAFIRLESSCWATRARWNMSLPKSS